MTDRIDHVCPLCGERRGLMSITLVDYYTREHCEDVIEGQWIAGVQMSAGPHYCDECCEFVTPREPRRSGTPTEKEIMASVSEQLERQRGSKHYHIATIETGLCRLNVCNLVVHHDGTITAAVVKP